ncbi:hypothetical protein NPIL_448641 [Nephila pilipes]|uniref:Uncharacterized protein n=1 Tax=Nephila pilipes TaxID=299642 RepID=A0A8X6K053_NEPPI|nr:hypothetical protein NPIL_448641 [Nephila pilipes]
MTDTEQADMFVHARFMLNGKCGQLAGKVASFKVDESQFRVLVTPKILVWITWGCYTDFTPFALEAKSDKTIIKYSRQ